MDSSLSSLSRDRLNVVIGGLEVKLNEARKTVESLLAALDQQEKLEWNEFLDKFTSASNDLVTIQNFLRRASVFPSSEDGTEFLRKQLIVPKSVVPHEDAELSEMTDGRVPIWNHDTVPLYLRTKQATDVESEEQSVEAGVIPDDKAHRQTQTTGKSIEQLILFFREQPSSISLMGGRNVPHYRRGDTEKLARAVNNGEGLEPNRGPSDANTKSKQ
ncbi:hypothetical protein QR680_003231 [Steinernema hermaphroditum]|uniref:Mediator of RNA polymerase II transcription subunit 8 n=1 Tax=Steinernema hermaphroditum TaxID=289476 RepID=A0AA39H8G6_9BILA|nr:hypothetical protein QR680_003231 [Steinernema hermaphroditum]